MKNDVPQAWWQSYCSENPQLLKSDPKAKTHKYWNYGGEEDTRLKFYVENLLPWELYYAQRKNRLHPLRCDVLVLLVGYSMEPLFQIISVFAPREKIVLLVNQVYDRVDERGNHVRSSGHSYGADVKEWVEELLLPQVFNSQNLPAIEIRVIGDVVPSDSVSPDGMMDTMGSFMPAAVFQTLCAYVLSDYRAGKKVIIDITGGKKSMDVGAFLFAAYADIPVSYVDFEEYHPKHRRPYGYTCHISELQSPYEAFGLRDWEEVRNLFEKYHFRAARKILKRVLNAMTELFTSAQVQSAERLDQILQLYAAWDDGDYGEAKAINCDIQASVKELNRGGDQDEVGFRPPAIVNLQQPIRSHVDLKALPTIRNQLRNWQNQRISTDSDFLMSNRRLLSYARDELKKIRRLVSKNEDNRSALLRAMGLDELLLKARWLRLYSTRKIDYYNENEERVSLVARESQEIRAKIIEYQGTVVMYKALTRDELFYDRNLNRDVDCFLGINRGRRGRYRARPNVDVAKIALPMADISGSSAYQFFYQWLVDLRNQAIHKYQYVDKKVASAAFKVAEANLREFETVNNGWLALADDWTGEVQPVNDPGRLDWEGICQLCGLDFLPF